MAGCRPPAWPASGASSTSSPIGASSARPVARAARCDRSAARRSEPASSQIGQRVARVVAGRGRRLRGDAGRVGGQRQRLDRRQQALHAPRRPRRPGPAAARRSWLMRLISVSHTVAASLLGVAVAGPGGRFAEGAPGGLLGRRDRARVGLMGGCLGLLDGGVVGATRVARLARRVLRMRRAPASPPRIARRPAGEAPRRGPVAAATALGRCAGGLGRGVRLARRLVGRGHGHRPLGHRDAAGGSLGDGHRARRAFEEGRRARMASGWLRPMRPGGLEVERAERRQHAGRRRRRPGRPRVGRGTAGPRTPRSGVRSGAGSVVTRPGPRTVRRRVMGSPGVSGRTTREGQRVVGHGDAHFGPRRDGRGRRPAGRPRRRRRQRPRRGGRRARPRSRGAVGRADGRAGHR